MALFRQWVDFVIHPSKPGFICSLTERLDTSQAVDPRSKEYKWGMKAIIFEKDVLHYEDDDDFEAMEIGRYGSVTIWTRHRVWTILNEAGRIESLKYVLRHPPTTQQDELL